MALFYRWLLYRICSGRDFNPRWFGCCAGAGAMTKKPTEEWVNNYLETEEGIEQACEIVSWVMGIVVALDKGWIDVN